MTNASAKWMPELGHCSCGDRVWLVVTQEGWAARCNCCGKKAEASFLEEQAVENWQLEMAEKAQQLEHTCAA